MAPSERCHSHTIPIDDYIATMKLVTCCNLRDLSMATISMAVTDLNANEQISK